MSLDVDMCIEQLKKCELLKENEVKILCAKAKEVLIEEGNVQRVEAPVTVICFGLKGEGMTGFY
jgi:serine/threonine-protein phosphatase 4 catalytic subunit